MEHNHTTEELSQIVAERSTREREAQDEANRKKADKVAAFVMRRLAKGDTDMPARSGVIPPILAYAHLDAAVQPRVKEILGESGIQVDFYNTYKGAGDDEDRIAVTQIGDTPVEPSGYYEWELKLRQLGERNNRDER